MNTEWLERTELLLSPELMKKLASAHVLVAGAGGVGAYAAEMIVRAGIGKMTIVDADTVSLSNCNRQLIALRSTIGKDKVNVLAERLMDIHPELQLKTHKIYLQDELIPDLLDNNPFDFVVDAIDTLTPKVNLIAETMKRQIPLVSSMGVGSKLDPTRVEITDIGKTHHCPLAHMLRKRLHKIGIRSGFQVVFSAEPIREGSMILCNEQNKKSNVGTISYMPAVFGCACASVAIRTLIGEY